MQEAAVAADEKRIVIRRAALLAALAALACAAPAAAADGPTILVKFASATGASAKVAALGDDPAGKTVGSVEVVDPQAGETVADALARYRARPDVVYAETNRPLHVVDVSAPSDTRYGEQWALPAVSALAGWSIFPGTFSPSLSVPIGIVDTGVDATHPDLAGRVSSSSATCLSSVCTEGVPNDDDGHGTHVSGIAGAATDNAEGIAGLAFGSPLIVARVFPPDASQGADLSDVANGIAWAASHGAKVINLSLGGAGSYPVTLCNAVQQALSTGAVVVAAAGNGSVSTPFYPAACPGAVGVGATDSSDVPGSFSNYGSPDVFVSAPGVDILSTWPGGQYASASGTSMASPYVAALVGLIRSMHPEASVTQVRMMLAMTSDKVGAWPYGTDPYATCAGCTWETHYGYGRIDVQSALSSAVPAAPPPPPPPTQPPPPLPPPPAAVQPKDTKAPVVHVYAARGRHRVPLKLRYRVRDDRGRTSERVLVYRKSRVVRTLERPLRTTDDSVAYWVRLSIATRGFYRYCVRATDAADNRSPVVCAAVRIR